MTKFLLTIIGDFKQATRFLGAQNIDFQSLGGSVVQRDVVMDTLIDS